MSTIRNHLYNLVKPLFIAISYVKDLISPTIPYLYMFCKLLLTILLSPIVLLNYLIVKLSVAIIQHKMFNIFKVELATCKSIILYTLILIEITVLSLLVSGSFGFFTAVAAFSIFGLNPVTYVLGNIVVLALYFTVGESIEELMYEIISKPLQIIDAEISAAASDLRQELYRHRRPTFIVQPAPVIDHELEKSLDAAIKDLNINALLDFLKDYGKNNNPLDHKYFWDDAMEYKLGSIRSNSIGVWCDLDPLTFASIDNRNNDTDLCCAITYGLKTMPVLTNINGRVYKDDLLTLLKRLSDSRGILRERDPKPIRYESIRIDEEAVVLIKAIKAKAQDMQASIFKEKCKAAAATNDYKEVLEHLQKIEIKHDLSLGALYWHTKLQQALDKFQASALDPKIDNMKYPREHCCSISLKVMQNPCYIVDPNDPAKKIYYEAIELLKWISDNDNLPIAQSENNSNQTASVIELRLPLLSQITYDNKLKQHLEAAYYSKYQKALKFMYTTFNPASYFSSMYRAKSHAPKASRYHLS